MLFFFVYKETPATVLEEMNPSAERSKGKVTNSAAKKQRRKELSPMKGNQEESLESWNPMEEDFLSRRNKYNIDVDDVGVATTGHSKFFSTVVVTVNNVSRKAASLCQHPAERE